jgi:hypothetical protein
MQQSILAAYGFNTDKCVIKTFGTGLINTTWIVDYDNEEYILQKVNHQVFKNPFAISNNIRAVGDYLKQHSPDYLFVTPLLSTDHRDLVMDGEDYYRLFPFIKNSLTFTTLESPDLAYEAAKQFGLFTHLLSGFDISQLQETLPNFHNLQLRYVQFEDAFANGNKERMAEAEDCIRLIEKYHFIVDEFEKIQRNKNFKKRVMHHDTKISNVLFDNNHKGLCIIDLDTVMPGYFISDVGDMMRTYLCPVSEEEKDFSKIEIRDDYYAAIVDGYLSQMHVELTDEEQTSFLYAGQFMIFMQAVRFLADYFNNDVYYGSKYEGHNLVRTRNQLHLLNRLQEKEEHLLQRIKQHKYFLLSEK